MANAWVCQAVQIAVKVAQEWFTVLPSVKVISIRLKFICHLIQKLLNHSLKDFHLFDSVITKNIRKQSVLNTLGKCSRA